MTYASGGLIQATDYNNFVASANAIWGSGTLGYGYGQSTTLSTVSAGVSTVTATQWSDLISRVDSMRLHQSGSATGITAPTSGTQIAAITTLSSQIASATTNRYSAIALGTAVTTAVTNSAGWISSFDMRVTYTWSSANAMRYFFNAGGIVSFTGVNSSLGGNTKSVDWDNLLAATGVVQIRAETSAKAGGSGSPNILNTNLGFYNLSTGFQTILQQTSTLSPYTANTVLFQAMINTTPGAATVLTIRMVGIDGASDVLDDTVSGTVRMDYAYTPPSTAVLANTWGAITTSVTVNSQG